MLALYVLNFRNTWCLISVGEDTHPSSCCRLTDPCKVKHALGNWIEIYWQRILVDELNERYIIFDSKNANRSNLPPHGQEFNAPFRFLNWEINGFRIPKSVSSSSFKTFK